MSQELSFLGDDPDVEVSDQGDDPAPLVGSADTDVMELGAVAKGEDATRIDLGEVRGAQPEECGYPGCMGATRPTTASLTAIVTREGDWYTAQCVEVDQASQGRTVDEAIANLSEALSLLLEDEPLPEHLEHPLVTHVDVPLAV